MIRRKVFSLATALLALTLASCDSYNPFEPGSAFEVTPLFFDMEFGQTQTVTATLDGQPVQVTWASSDPAIFSVNQTGPSTAVVTPLAPGSAALTATLASDPSQLRSASITVLPTFTIFRVTDLARATGFFFWEIEIPEGLKEAIFRIRGGTGDADIYVFGPDGEECVPWLAGNNETCTFPNPTPGTWEVYLDAFDPFTGVTFEVLGER
jgi:vibriolysin